MAWYSGTSKMLTQQKIEISDQKKITRFDKTELKTV